MTIFIHILGYHFSNTLADMRPVPLKHTQPEQPECQSNAQITSPPVLHLSSQAEMLRVQQDRHRLIVAQLRTISAKFCQPGLEREATNAHATVIVLQKAG